MDPIWEVAGQFLHTGTIHDVQEYGNGNINDTYLVTVQGDEADNFVLQRINTRVFTRPRLIVKNLRTYTEHVEDRLRTSQDLGARQWDVPRIWQTHAGEDFFEGSDGSFWRAISFVNHSKSYDTVLNDQHAREAGYALGCFQSMVSDLSTDKMYDTLEGFHITPQYLANYHRVQSGITITNPSPEIDFCQQVIDTHCEWATVLEDAKTRGELQLRIIHGDPKINNFLISDLTGQAVSVIDLDTVKPGLVHYDIGDCLRSSCNPLGEETTEFDNVVFDVKLAKLILEGYISIAQGFLTAYDYEYIQDAIRLIPFELGLRFFTDYLADNKYFKVRYPEHNLDRARVQFKLLESIEAQEQEIRAMITAIKTQEPVVNRG